MFVNACLEEVQYRVFWKAMNGIHTPLPRSILKIAKLREISGKFPIVWYTRAMDNNVLNVALMEETNKCLAFADLHDRKSPSAITRFNKHSTRFVYKTETEVEVYWNPESVHVEYKNPPHHSDNVRKQKIVASQ